MFKPLLFLLGLVVLSPLARGQGKVSFDAFADARKVVKDGYFEITFTLHNAEGSSFKPPSFEGFTILSGPFQSMGTTVINGATTREESYIYRLQPRRTGSLTIGSATIRANGHTYRSLPITVQVVEGKGSEEKGKELFIIAEPSTTKAWVGQQVLLDYKLYTAISYKSPALLEESGYQGFYAEDVRQYDSRDFREVYEGVQYISKVLKRVALFPQQAGELTITPMSIQVSVVKENSGRQRNFFFTPEMERVPLSTEPVTIQVEPLPLNAPASFTGAVGSFKVTPYLNRTKVTTDDVLSLRLTISGNGDIKRVQAPPLKTPGNFELYDPTVAEEETYELNGDIQGKKTFEYLMLPKEAGQYTLQPEFSWFDPDSSRFITYSASVYELEVRKGSGQGAAARRGKDEGAAQEDIAPLKTDVALRASHPPFSGGRLFWALFALPFLGLAGVLAYKRWSALHKGIDPATLRIRQARKVAQERLAQAELHLKAANNRAFYDELSKAMLGYASDKLRIARSELAKDKLQVRLEEAGLGQEQVKQFLEIISTCELALFAGKTQASDMQATFGAAVQAISQMEKQLTA
ncbi:MAG: protein BatD [Phaeodactylibacter sp.]|nr:protein BatD [Phaeodactylibacter sp.]MCB9272623.1 protein BatD [Lewinellaceae bacterium]